MLNAIEIFRNGSDPALYPLVTIHGGPGFDHQYLLPMKQLACAGRKVLFYDQVSWIIRCVRADGVNTGWLWSVAASSAHRRDCTLAADARILPRRAAAAA